MTTSLFKREKKVLGLIKMDNYYHSPWNEVLNPLVSQFTFGQDSITDQHLIDRVAEANVEHFFIA